MREGGGRGEGRNGKCCRIPLERALMRSGRVVVSAGAMTHAQYKTHHGVRASTHFHAHLRVYIAGTHEVGIPPEFCSLFLQLRPTFFFYVSMHGLRYTSWKLRGYRMGTGPQRNGADNFGDPNRPERNSYRSFTPLSFLLPPSLCLSFWLCGILGKPPGFQ